MVDYSYLSASNKRHPLPQYQIDGDVLLSGKSEVPLFWYILFSPQDVKYPKFENITEDEFWYREQPPYLIVSKEKACANLTCRQKNLFRILHSEQVKLFDQFSKIITDAEHSYIHLYADPVVRHFEFGILKKKMLDILHFCEQLENPISDTDMLFSPLAYELGVNPKAFPASWITPKFILRKFQHKFWEWRGLSAYERDIAPLRSERSFVPPTQFNLVGHGENVVAPWQ